MEGYQFIHIEVYSVKGAPGRGGDEYLKRKNGDRAWSASQVIDEAERMPGACPHIISGRPGPEILPAAVSSFSELRAAHDAASKIKSTHIRINRNGKQSKVSRKLRADAASLYSCVVSLPVRSEEALADPDLRERSVALLKAAMQQEEDRLHLLGGTMLMGVVHWDEEHLHAHFLAIDRTRGRVDSLHPGRAAKAAHIAAKASETPSKKQLNQDGNRAYCDAMREWQTEFHEGVFRDAGLLRYGPGRTRMPRAQYKRAKAAAAERAADIERRKELRTERRLLMQANETLDEIAKIDAENMRDWETHIEEQRVANEERAAGLDVREDALAEREAGVEKREISARKREANAARREVEADAAEALIEAAGEGFVRIEDGDAEARIIITKTGRSDDRWPALQQRIRRAMPAAKRLAGRLSKGMAKLTSSAEKAGREEARRKAKLDLREARNRLAAAMQAAGHVTGIAKIFAKKLRQEDADEMLRRIDGELRSAAQHSIASKSIEEASGCRHAMKRD